MNFKRLNFEFSERFKNIVSNCTYSGPYGINPGYGIDALSFKKKLFGIMFFFSRAPSCIEGEQELDSADTVMEYVVLPCN